MKIKLTSIFNDATVSVLKETLGEEVFDKLENIEVDSGEQKFIPKAKFDEQKQQIELLTDQIKERDGKIADLGKLQNLTEEQKAKIDELTESTKQMTSKFETQMLEYKTSVAWDKALSKAGAKNEKALKGMIDATKVSYDEKQDILTGFEEQLAQIKKENDWLFTASVPTSGGHPNGTPTPHGDEFSDFRKL